MLEGHRLLWGHRVFKFFVFFFFITLPVYVSMKTTANKDSSNSKGDTLPHVRNEAARRRIQARAREAFRMDVWPVQAKSQGAPWARGKIAASAVISFAVVFFGCCCNGVYFVFNRKACRRKPDNNILYISKISSNVTIIQSKDCALLRHFQPQ